MADVDDGDGWPKSTHILNRPPDDATAPSSPRGVVPAAIVAASVSIVVVVVVPAMMTPPRPSVVPSPLRIRDDALSSSPPPLAESSFDTGGSPPSPLSSRSLSVARHHSPRHPCQDEVDCHRGCVRHDRPRQTPCLVVIIITVAHGIACAGGRW